MFVGRKEELLFLNEHYTEGENEILVMYGRKGVGKTTLLTVFTEEKPSFYYMARSCSEREQRFQWARELGMPARDFPEYAKLFEESILKAGGWAQKPVLILDEFHHLIKSDPLFMPALLQFVYESGLPNGILVILCSSAAGWIENSMVSKMGKSAAGLKGLWKVREMKYRDMRSLFPEYGQEESLLIYGILGGNPGLWKSFSPELTFRENCIRNLLTVGCALQEEMSVYLLEELRETAVYNTILATMAEGITKLNDLYFHTGFSRAKISVYLKNLMELDLVDKIASFEADQSKDTQKGIYRISNSYVRFYYRFLYPAQSDLQRVPPEQFYEKYLADKVSDLANEAYLAICRQELSTKLSGIGEWIGKKGKIDLVGRDRQGGLVAAACIYGRECSVRDYQAFADALKCAKMKPKELLFFTEGGVSLQLAEFAQELPIHFCRILQNGKEE